MAIKEYDIEKFTDKDMFQMRLKGDTPDFGYISIRLRRPFLELLVKYEFLQDNGSVMARLKTHKDSKTFQRRYSEFRNQYKVLEGFHYWELRDYSPDEIKVHAKADVFTVKDWRMFAMQLQEEL